MGYLFGTPPDLCLGDGGKAILVFPELLPLLTHEYLSKEQSRKVRNTLPQPPQELSAGVWSPDRVPSPLPGGSPTGPEAEQSCGSAQDMSRFG